MVTECILSMHKALGSVPTLGCLFECLGVFFGLLCEASSHSVAEADLDYSLCSPGWIQTHNNSPASEITGLIYHNHILYSGFKQNGNVLGIQQKWDVTDRRAFVWIY